MFSRNKIELSTKDILTGIFFGLLSVELVEEFASVSDELGLLLELPFTTDLLDDVLVLSLGSRLLGSLVLGSLMSFNHCYRVCECFNSYVFV